MARIAGINVELERNWSHSLPTHEDKLRLELHEILKQEEIFWHPKSRTKWITNGDRNTRFFHISTMSPRKRNKIDRLPSEEVVWIEDQDALKNMAVRYFQNLLTDEGGPSINPISTTHFPRLDPALIKTTFEQVSSLEIRKAIFGMGAVKARSPC